ncbi:hypothetical protein FACS1894214_2020 [Planctomycetales bacterium]|nr:hypothetical protein FACS1894214_2020 [Planctomycetales bacterium]
MTSNVTHVRPKNGQLTHFKVNGSEKARETCIREIESGIDYKTSPRTGSGASIHVVEADHKKYLRTDKNKTPADNLGELPSF